MMTQDAGHNMKVRLRADLGVALKERRIGEVRLIRTLVAAIENAEAPPLHAGRKAADQHSFRDGTAEIERRVLDSAMVRSALMAEIQEREHAAAELERLQRTDRADALRADAVIARRYVE